MRYICWKEFKSDGAVKPGILGLVHDTHASTAEFFKDAEMRDCLAEEWLGVHHFAGY